MEQGYLTRARAALERRTTSYEISPVAGSGDLTGETKEVRHASPDPFFVLRTAHGRLRWLLLVRLTRIGARSNALPADGRPDFTVSPWDQALDTLGRAWQMRDAARLAAALDTFDRLLGLPCWEPEQQADPWADLRALLAGGALALVGTLTLSTGAVCWDVAGCCRVWLEELGWPPQRANAVRQLCALREALGELWTPDPGGESCGEASGG